MEVATAQCRTEDDVIAAARGCGGLLTQYAPMNARVFAALPEVRIVSRFGAGFDTVERAAARSTASGSRTRPTTASARSRRTRSPWRSRSCATPLYDRDVRAGSWHYALAGALARATELTLGILGLGRIGKRMCVHLAQRLRHACIACDPYIIDGDFPAYVRRASEHELFRKADIVSLHVPLNDETRGIVGARVLALMKRGSVS